MKYYYGNSIKEAHSNSPVEIQDCETLEQYKEIYSVVIPKEESSMGTKTFTLNDGEVGCILDALSYYIDERRDDIHEGYIDIEDIGNIEMSIEEMIATYESIEKQYGKQ